MSRSVSVNSGAVARRPSISAPRIRPPAVSGTTMSGPISASSQAPAAARRSSVTRLGLPVRIACPAGESASGAARFIRFIASAPLTPVTIA